MSKMDTAQLALPDVPVARNLLRFIRRHHGHKVRVSEFEDGMVLECETCAARLDAKMQWRLQ